MIRAERVIGAADVLVYVDDAPVTHVFEVDVERQLVRRYLVPIRRGPDGERLTETLRGRVELRLRPGAGPMAQALVDKVTAPDTGS